MNKILGQDSKYVRNDSSPDFSADAHTSPAGRLLLYRLGRLHLQKSTKQQL